IRDFHVTGVQTCALPISGRALGYTASAVSQQMMLLEKAVGAPLFERAARSARSTKLAGQLAERSRSALRALEALEREVRAMVSRSEERRGGKEWGTPGTP